MVVLSSNYYTEQSRWFMEQLLLLEPASQNGGIFANKPGYHNTITNNQKNWPGNYSIIDAVDKTGLDKAAAYDWTFTSAQKADYERIAYYTNLLLKSAKDQDDPRLNGWREFYGQADKDTAIEGWDTRYGVPATSDLSHLWHIHMSEQRNLVDSLDNKIAMLSVLKGETVAQWREGITVMGAPQTFNYQGKTWFSGGGTRRWIRNPQEAELIFKQWGVTWPDPKKVAEAKTVDIIYGPDITESFLGFASLTTTKLAALEAELTAVKARLAVLESTESDADTETVTEAEAKEIFDELLSEVKVIRNNE